MSGRREYVIDIFGLKPGEHAFDYEIGNSFFQLFEQSPITQGQLQAAIVLHKSERMLTLQVTLVGEVELTCDRSMDPFMYPLNLNQEMIFQFGEEEKELDDDVYMIHWDTQQLHIAQYLYEFMVVAVPMKKLHPRYLEDETYEDEIVFTAKAVDDDNSEEGPVDPRWEALKKLKKDS